MPTTLITDAQVVTLDRILPAHSVLIADGRIQRLAPAAELADTPAENLIDAAGQYLIPGLIDLHIHGIHTYLADDGPEAVAHMAAILPRYGVTGFLPTFFPSIKADIEAFAAAAAQVDDRHTARILGFFFEGPFLAHSGAGAPNGIGSADPRRAAAIAAASRPRRAIFAVSPELPGMEELVPVMARDNTPVFITHTAATVAQTQKALALGVCHATHFYNVFPPSPESEPGVRGCGAVEAVLAEPRCSVDFILDGVHVAPIAVQAALQTKGPDRVCLITDANVGAGLPPGKYRFTGAEIEFAEPGGPARLGPDSHYPGALAGSGLTLDQAVRNALNLLALDLPYAVRLASANPASVLRLGHRLGRIAPDYDADLVLLDNNLSVTRTIIAGDTVYQRQAP